MSARRSALARDQPCGPVVPGLPNSERADRRSGLLIGYGAGLSYAAQVVRMPKG
ncbi:hypothetical protein BCGT_0316 [Mycobacterium tuberculosis variant bovis BCG str. ATCC 35743]|nr:hypothetical protein BCGT_0316 [Mycobacterium tuberculosis variant bovis BCG str. ATCC 35743]